MCFEIIDKTKSKALCARSLEWKSLFVKGKKDSGWETKKKLLKARQDVSS